MLDGIVNLALLTGAGLCVWLLAYGSYQVVKFLFGRERLKRVIARLALYESTHLIEDAE